MTTEMMTTAEMTAAEHEGLIGAADLSWHPRDTGGSWLVVERGSRMHDGRDVWSRRGVIVGTAKTAGEAAQMARRDALEAHGRGVRARYTVVARVDIEVTVTEAAYGCSL